MQLKPQQKIVLIYMAVAVIWIFFSDALVATLFDEPGVISAQLYKGLMFVLVTGVLLYFLVDRHISIIEKAHEDLIASYEQTILGWVQVMDLRHKETKDHAVRVAMMAAELARLSGVPKKSLEEVRRGAVLHDIGKIGIPDSILTKPGKLDVREWEQMKKHPVIAYELLSSINYLKPLADIPYCHHEKWDGSGYPRGLKGNEIPLTARIFAVVDVWEALISPRVYRPAWSEEDTLRHIASQSGSHFDPEIVRIFLDNFELLKKTVPLEPIQEPGQVPMSGE